ncbi:MAG: o-succinylbenzoate synthase, partial [Thermoprotei archaeon]
WGEVAPLPGFSRESLSDAVSQLQFLKTALMGMDIPAPDELAKLNGAFETWLGSYQLFPSVRFGLESAVLRLIARERQAPLRSLISTEATDKVSVCALLSGTNDEILEKTQESKAEGFKTVKLKVGRQSLEDDVTLVHTVRQQIGERIALRLDANRAWDIEQAMAFMDQVKNCDIEYIEEPAHDYLGILQLCNILKGSVPIALDESLGTISPSALSPTPEIVAVILKPTILGLERSVRFARRANKLGMKAVVSSSFESGLGLATLTELGAGLNRNRDLPLGVDTVNSLTHDILERPLEIKRGQIDLTTQTVQNPQPRLDLLDEVKDA